MGGASKTHGRARSCSISRQSQHPQQTQHVRQQQLSTQPAGESATSTKRSKSKKYSSNTSIGSLHRHRLTNDDYTASVSETPSKKTQSSASVTRKGSYGRQRRLVDNAIISSVSADPITQSKKNAPNNKQARPDDFEREGSTIPYLVDDDAASSTHNESWSQTKNTVSKNRKFSSQSRSSSRVSGRDSTTSKNVQGDNDDCNNSHRLDIDKQRPKSKPAFPGAKFDAQGNCIHHPSMRLQERRFDKWHIFHKHCPLCRGNENGNSGKGKRDKESNRGDTTSASRPVDKIIEIQPEESNRGRSLYRIRSLSRGVVRSVSKAHHNGNCRSETHHDGNCTVTASPEREGHRAGGKIMGRLSNRLHSSDKINDVDNSRYQSVDEKVNSVKSSNSNDDVRRKAECGSDGSVGSTPKKMRVATPPPSCDDSNIHHDDRWWSSSWRQRDYCQDIAAHSASGNPRSSRRRMNSFDLSFDRVRQARSFDSQSPCRREGRRRSYTRSSSPSSSSRSPYHRDGNRKYSISRDGTLPPPPGLRRNHSQRNDQSSPMSSRGDLSGTSRQPIHRNRSLMNTRTSPHRMRRSFSPSVRRRSKDHRDSCSPSARSSGSSRSRRIADQRMGRVDPPQRSFSRGRAVSTGRRGRCRQNPPIRSHSQLSRLSLCQGRPLSNGRRGGRLSKSEGPISANSRALVVRKRTPSPNRHYTPRRHRSSSRRPPVENQLVEYDFSHIHRRIPLSSAKSRCQHDNSSPPSKFRPQSSSGRRQRNAMGRSKSPTGRPTRAKLRSPLKTRSRSSTPEIWIVCPITEDDPFENSFATFEEWNFSPPSQLKLNEREYSGDEKCSSDRLRPIIGDSSFDRLQLPLKRNSFDLSPPMHNSVNRRETIRIRQNNSFYSLEDAGAPLSRENSLERRLPEWSDLNSRTRSKAANLSMLSQQISTMSRRDSRTRNGSPERQLTASIFRRERQNSLERTLPTSMKQSKSCNSLESGKAPMRLENSIEQSSTDDKFRTRSKATDLLEISQEISTVSRRDFHSRSRSTGRGHIIHDLHIGDSTRGDLERRTSGLRYSFVETLPQVEKDIELRPTENLKVDVISPSMSQVEKALAIIEEAQGKKLPRWDNKQETKMLSRAEVISSSAAPKPTPSRPLEISLPLTSKGPRRPTTVASTSPIGSAGNRRNSKIVELRSNFTRRANVPAVASVLGDSEETPNVNVAPPPLPPPLQRQKQQQVTPQSFSTLSIKSQYPSFPISNDRQKNQADQRQNQSNHPRQSPIDPNHDGNNHQRSINHEAERSIKEKRRGREPRKQMTALDEGMKILPVVGKGGEGRKSTMVGRGREPPKKNGTNIDRNCRSVKHMPFTDQFSETGMYTGQVNEDCRPDGKGSMKYENGVYYEGMWSNGCQDENAASQYGRIRGGFTGWSGKGKEAPRSGMTMPWNARRNDAYNPNEKINVRGMEWSDINGQSGRYTGEANKDRIPHGRGQMKYDYGLIADGRWVNGVLEEGPQDRMISASASMGAGTDAMTVASNLSRPLSSLGPAISVGAGMSVGQVMSSLGPGSAMCMQGPGFPIGPTATIDFMPTMPHAPMQFVNMNQQHAMMMMMMHGGGRSIHGTPMMGMPMTMPMQPPMQIILPQTQQQPQEVQLDKPPVSEIKINAENL